jgi:hypothetical protein
MKKTKMGLMVGLFIMITAVYQSEISKVDMEARMNNKIAKIMAIF